MTLANLIPGLHYPYRSKISVKNTVLPQCQKCSPPKWVKICREYCADIPEVWSETAGNLGDRAYKIL